MHVLYQLLEKLNPTKRVIDVRVPCEYNQWHVPGRLNIPMGNEQAFVDENRGYDRVFLHCHSGRRTQTVYSRFSIQGLEDLVCINSSDMTDWHQSSFPVDQ